VFRALNIVECVLVAVAAGLLVVQLVAIRPRLNRRTDRVLNAPAGADLPRSRAHVAYVAVELVKVGALVSLGIANF
jgi:hypothetical protein